MLRTRRKFAFSFVAVWLLALVASPARATETDAPLYVASLRTIGVLAGALSTREIRIERQGDQLRVHAQADIEADRPTIWSTLSDYDHLAQFIPSMSSSRTLARDGPNVLIEQKGTAGLGPFRRSFTVTFAVTERLDESISASVRAGDFSRFDARYEIVRLATGSSRIVYEATIVPVNSAPPLVNDVVLRLMIADQFDALIREMARRAELNAAPSRLNS